MCVDGEKAAMMDCHRIRLLNSSLHTTLEELWRDQSCLDVTITCADGQLKAHRLILASASSFLKRLLGNLQGGLEDNIVLPDIKKTTVQKVLALVYAGRVWTNHNEVKEAFLLAAMLGIDISNVEKHYEDAEAPDSLQGATSAPDVFLILRTTLRSKEEVHKKRKSGLSRDEGNDSEPLCAVDAGGGGRKMNRAEGKKKRIRTKYTEDQVAELKSEFYKCQYLTEERREALAESLHLTEKQIQIWFQNRRKEKPTRKEGEKRHGVDDEDVPTDESNVCEVENDRSGDKSPVMQFSLSEGNGEASLSDGSESRKGKRIRIRTAFTQGQLCALKRAFSENKYLTDERCEQLCESLGLGEDQIKTWFKNRRTYMRRDHERAASPSHQPVRSLGTRKQSNTTPIRSLSKKQVERLSEEFAKDSRLTNDRLQQMAQELNLTEGQVSLWFRYNKSKLLQGEGPEYLCHYCGEKFALKRSLEEHINDHTREKVFMCPFCNKTFNRLRTMQLHEKSHTDPEGIKTECHLCGKVLKQANLKRHLQSHASELPHKCKFCPKSFTYERNLLDHEHTHTGARPYHCQFCDKSFGFYSGWARHVKTQHGATAASLQTGSQAAEVSGLEQPSYPMEVPNADLSTAIQAVSNFPAASQWFPSWT